MSATETAVLLSFSVICQHGKFRCSDGTCIPREGVCNRRNDCSNGEDEEDCSDGKTDVMHNK